MSSSSSPSSVAIRAYVLALSFSTLPAVFPTVLAHLKAKPTLKSSRTSSRTVFDVLRRELGPTGLPFAMAIAAGGGKWLSAVCERQLSRFQDTNCGKTRGEYDWQETGRERLRVLAYTFSSWIAIRLLHARRRALKVSPYPLTFPVGNQPGPGRASPTLDFTLLVLVRALDAFVGRILGGSHPRYVLAKDMRRLRPYLDAFVFWVSCSRIMWCFFYEPRRLPKSYNRWIASLASIDPRIVEALRALRKGTWQYGSPSLEHHDLLASLSRDLGYPSSWGRPDLIPSRGGRNASSTWRELGVFNRDGIGGIPCEIVHGGIGGGSCVANASVRGLRAFLKALLIYLPVHFLPTILSKPQNLAHIAQRHLLSSIQSASFLAAFVSSIWFFVCFTRTLVVARMFPFVSHNVWDGPTFGCITMGSILCGASIFVEAGRRRAEMALYVLPRAIRTSLNEAWITGGMRSIQFPMVERLVFALSLGYLLATSAENLEPLRGLSRWTLRFVLRGPEIRTILWDVFRTGKHSANGKHTDEACGEDCYPKT